MKDESRETLEFDGEVNYSQYGTDEELVALAQSGREDIEEFLIHKYKYLVKQKAHIYFMAGADKEDVVQEGMIGIFKAIKNFDIEKNASFHTFAELCINRQIITAIKSASRMKHSPLNTSVSLNKPMSDSDQLVTLAETLSTDSNSDPEAMLLLKEVTDYIKGNGGSIFSELELLVLTEFLQGKSYSIIAEEMGKSPKAIDNAIQRTKRKIAMYLGKGTNVK